MENLVFSLNATVPIFLLMVLGYIFHKIHWVDDVFASKMNKFVFTVPLPVLVFKNLAEVDFREAWNGKFVLFCFLVTVVSICIAIGLSFLLKDKSNRGEFVQSSYRSSAALLGIAGRRVKRLVGRASPCHVAIGCLAQRAAVPTSGRCR